MRIHNDYFNIVIINIVMIKNFFFCLFVEKRSTVIVKSKSFKRLFSILRTSKSLVEFTNS